MSKERELLMRICKFLDSEIQNDFGFVSDIRYLLSQPSEEKLTMRQRLEEYKKGYAKAEQQLTAKNEKEPVAWMCNLLGNVVTDKPADNNGYTALYKSLKREPLSDDWIKDNIHLIHQDVSFTDLVRSIEKAHGIGKFDINKVLDL
jgi:hypothetical protein